MKKRTLYIFSGTILSVIVAVLIITNLPDPKGKSVVIRKGTLETVVSSLGEVRSEKYTEINVPEAIRIRDLRIWQLEIVDLVQEGKKVKKGDYIARLDDGEIMNRMKEKKTEEEKIDADLKNAIIDSAVVLTQKREDIINGKLDLEYKLIDLEQAKYESEAYQRKTQIEYRKAEMQAEKLHRDYLLEQNKQKLIVSRLEDKSKEVKNIIGKYQKALQSTTILAPENGIVMFAKDWTGKKYCKGDKISFWRPLLATLPEMSVVNSEVYVKEIDIAKIKVNDSVKVSIDALSNKEFIGRVVEIANIGEEHKGFDMKVFKVIARLQENDEELKEGMTTNNDIIYGCYTDRLLIPMTAVFREEGQSFAYLKRGNDIVKKEIFLEAENDESGAVLHGLDEGDRVLLYQPEEYVVQTELSNL